MEGVYLFPSFPVFSKVTHVSPKLHMIKDHKDQVFLVFLRSLLSFVTRGLGL